jgi:Cys-rich protein (TIGR01571 family)
MTTTGSLRVLILRGSSMLFLVTNGQTAPAETLVSNSSDSYDSLTFSHLNTDATISITMSDSDSVEPEVENFVDVVAPADLEGGYEIFVNTGRNTACKVRVPNGGVKKGHRFRASVVSETLFGGPHSIPYGHWRDTVCNCCSFGPCHPVICCNTWCSMCAMGQVLSRLRLNCAGGPMDPAEEAPFSSCKILCGISILYFLVQVSLIPLRAPITSFLVTLLGTVKELYAVAVTMRVRARVRKKYGIPEQHCIGCEDCCCSFWCMRCIMCQISRHTADYRKYRAGCCSESGFSPGSPEIV